MNRGLLHLLLCLLLVVTSTPAWAHCRPENRVGGAASFLPNLTTADDAKPIAASGENEGCGYDFASGVHKYLYCQNNPVNMTDPSGNDGELVGLMMSTSIGASLDSMYNGGVVFAGMAMQHTIIGVQNGETENAILGDYFLDVGEGLLEGYALGITADLAGDLVYGKSIEGEKIGIEVNEGNSFGGAQNFARGGAASREMIDAAAAAVRTAGAGRGPVYGTKVHVEFEKEVNSRGYENTEVAYKDGVEVTPGTEGSVEVDVAVGSRGSPEVIYDLKTGNAKLTKARVEQLRKHVPNGKDIAIIAVRPNGSTTRH